MRIVSGSITSVVFVNVYSILAGLSKRSKFFGTSEFERHNQNHLYFKRDFEYFP